MTKGEMVQRVIMNLRESTDPVHWTGTEIRHYLDDGIEEALLASKAQIENFTITCAPGQAIVNLDDRVISVIAARDVTLVGGGGMSFPIDFEYWRAANRSDQFFTRTVAQRPELMTSFGVDKVMIWPSYVQGGTMELACATLPATNLLDNEEPKIPPEYHVGIYEYAIGRCLVRDAVIGEHLGRAEKHFREFGSASHGLSAWGQKRHTNIKRAFGVAKLRNAGMTESSIIPGPRWRD
jgi:hypothetical protein